MRFNWVFSLPIKRNFVDRKFYWFLYEITVNISSISMIIKYSYRTRFVKTFICIYSSIYKKATNYLYNNFTHLVVYSFCERNSQLTRQNLECSPMKNNYIAFYRKLFIFLAKNSRITQSVRRLHGNTHDTFTVSH